MFSLFFSLLLLGATTASLLPDRADINAFVGSYTYAGRSSDIASRQTAIEGAANEFNFLIRPIARSRLEKNCFVVEELHFSLDEDFLTINSEKKLPLKGRFDGKIVHTKDTEGKPIAFWRIWQSDKSFVQIIQSKIGERRVRMSLHEDGKILKLEVTIVSEKLDNPLEFVSHYRRR